MSVKFLYLVIPVKMDISKPIIYLLKDKRMVNFTAFYTKEPDG